MQKIRWFSKSNFFRKIFSTYDDNIQNIIQEKLVFMELDIWKKESITMLQLTEIDYKEFKNTIYKYYEELFEKEERQPLHILKKLYEKGILKFVKIVDQDINVGFLIYATTSDNPYVWLDYFAIFKEYQNKKYGTEAIKIFKNYFKGYDGIYGEIEALGLGKNDSENKIREKRFKFWKNLGFELLNIDMNLFGVIYSACVLKLTDINRQNKDILNYGFHLYEAVMGKKEIEKKCFIVEKET